jgi:transcriptional regulator with XRE-family HTH domain
MSGEPRPDSETALRQRVGRRAYMRRVWLDLSQQELADKAGVTRNFVSAIERGAQGLDAWRLWALADGLGGTLDWLLTGPDDALTALNPGSQGASTSSQDARSPEDNSGTASTGGGTSGTS